MIAFVWQMFYIVYVAAARFPCAAILFSTATKHLFRERSAKLIFELKRLRHMACTLEGQAVKTVWF
jgi:hypothetical protein